MSDWRDVPMIRCPFCNNDYAYRIHRQWYTRWFGVLSTRRRYQCPSCSRRFWANTFLEVRRPAPPLRKTFIGAVQSVALDTDREPAEISG
jgi:hypothetical protein